MLTLGNKYRVIRAPAGEYLTVGEVYVCTCLTSHTVGLHRENNGGGTYARRGHLMTGALKLELVSPFRSALLEVL